MTIKNNYYRNSNSNYHDNNGYYKNSYHHNNGYQNHIRNSRVQYQSTYQKNRYNYNHQNNNQYHYQKPQQTYYQKPIQYNNNYNNNISYQHHKTYPKYYSNKQRQYNDYKDKEITYHKPRQIITKRIQKFNKPTSHQPSKFIRKSTYNTQKYKQTQVEEVKEHNAEFTIVLKKDSVTYKYIDYILDLLKFRKSFIQYLKFTNEYEATNIWGQLIMRSLNKQKFCHHPIPDPEQVKSDEDFIRHCCEKDSYDHQARDIQQKYIEQVQVFWDKYNEYKTEQQNDEQTKISISTRLKVFGDNFIDYNNRNSKNQMVKLKVSKKILKKLQTTYRGPQNLKNYYIFECLFNYQFLSGNTLQWGAPLQVLDLFQDQLKIQTEMFASPMNSYLPFFCSIFEIDKMFGGQGNFFNFLNNIEGCYYINPPFVEYIFQKSSEGLMAQVELAQSFDQTLLLVYVIPWEKTTGFNNLTEHKEFLIENIKLLKGEHIYYDHINDKYINANFDSNIIIIGTKKGRLIWEKAQQNNFMQQFKEKFNNKKD